MAWIISKQEGGHCLQEIHGMAVADVPKTPEILCILDETHPLFEQLFTAGGAYEPIIENGELVDVIDIKPEVVSLKLETERRKIHLLCGLPCSGKSTFIGKQQGSILRCDEWKINNPNHSQDMSEWRQYLSAMLNKCWDVSDIWIDQPTLGIASFKRFMDGVKLFASDRVYLHVFHTPIEVVKERNARRPTEKRHSDNFYNKHGDNPLITADEVAEFENVVYVKENGI